MVTRRPIHPHPQRPHRHARRLQRLRDGSAGTLAARRGRLGGCFQAGRIEQPYSYVYSGLTGRLDHALLSPSLAKQLRGAAEWHINADEQDAQGYANGDPAVRSRSSDHDPLLLGFDLRHRFVGAAGVDAHASSVDPRGFQVR